LASAAALLARSSATSRGGAVGGAPCAPLYWIKMTPNTTDLGASAASGGGAPPPRSVLPASGSPSREPGPSGEAVPSSGAGEVPASPVGPASPVVRGAPASAEGPASRAASVVAGPPFWGRSPTISA